MGIVTTTGFFPKQLEFFRNSNKRINIAVGAVRSGKTHVFGWRWFYHLLESGPGDYLMLGNTVSSLERNVLFARNGFLDILETCKKGMGIPYKYVTSGSHAGRQIRWGSGDDVRVIYVVGGGDKGAISTIQGMTAKGVYMDEAATYPIEVINMANTRCSLPESKMFMNCNPESPYHPLKTDYIDDVKKKDQTYHTNFLLDDNKGLDPVVVQNLKNSFTGVFYQRFIMSEWVLAEGIIYALFNQDKHVLSPNEVPKEFNKILIGIDWGQANPTTFIKIGVVQQGREVKFYLIDEYYHSGKENDTKTVASYYSDLIKFIGNDKIHGIYIDPSAVSLKAQFDPNLRRYLINSHNEVAPGIATVANYIAQDKLYVSNICKNAIREFYTYSWDEKSALATGKDNPIKQSDHVMDAIRYAIYTAFPIRTYGIRASGPTRQ